MAVPSFRRAQVINGGLSEGVQLLVDGVNRTGSITNTTTNNTDNYGVPIDIILYLDGIVIPAGAAVSVRGTIVHPDLMDWTDFLIAPNGPSLQQNLNAAQFTVTNNATPPVPQIHQEEVRVRTQP